MSAPDDLPDRIAGAFRPDPPARLGLAVSGGGDSTALLCLLARAFRDDPGVTLHAVTVDHGLRAEARAEAEGVGRLCAGLGLSHDILTWTGWDRSGNLQAEARRARYALMTAWAAGRGITDVTLGHTADDQAETVLMRLSRAAGTDGLSGMAPRRTRGAVTWHRPMLGLRRADLRDWLTAEGIPWVEDPSNEDPAFDRIRTRKALDGLADLGITVPALCTVAENAGRERAALDRLAGEAARRVVRIVDGDVLLDRAEACAMEPELLRRIAARAILWITGTDYAPRGRALLSLVEALRDGRPATLHGCQVLVRGGTAHFLREPAAVRHSVAAPGAPWDGRWRLDGPRPEGAEIRALGVEGLAECPGWRDTGRERHSLLASPAAWRDGRLVAAPLAGRPEGWTARLCRKPEAFHAAFLSH